MISSTPTTTPTNMPTREQISQRAHEIWVTEGRPEGKALEHWQCAEKELCARIACTKPTPAPSGVMERSTVKNRIKFNQPVRTAGANGRM